MSLSKDQRREWQERLEGAFQFQESVNGQMPSLVSTLMAEEERHRKQITAHGYGFRVLTLSYQDFAIRTLEEAPNHGNVLNVYNYAMNWAAFRRLRSSWNAYNNGYYEDAASLLRSVLEITMYLSCVLRGCFGFQRIHDLDEKPDFDTVTAKQFIKGTRVHNRKLANEIRDNVYGASSGLSETERNDIEVLLWTHHSHVHRSESSVIREVLGMMASKRVPSVAPEVDLERASVFCNAAVLAAWTHVRVLPYLSVPSQYSEGWQERYRVLDEAFGSYIEAWEKSMKNAFMALIETSYTFDESIALRQVLADST